MYVDVIVECSQGDIKALVDKTVYEILGTDDIYSVFYLFGVFSGRLAAWLDLNLISLSTYNDLFDELRSVAFERVEKLGIKEAFKG